MAVSVHHTCADLLFSGHTATYTLFALFWSHYSRGDDFRACGLTCEGVWLGLPDTDAVGDPSGFHWGKLLPWSLFLVGVFFILSTHFHYSIDGHIAYRTPQLCPLTLVASSPVHLCFSDCACTVYVAFILTSLLFHLYHYYVKVTLEQRTAAAAFFRWFEHLDRQPLGPPRSTGPREGEEGEEVEEEEEEGEGRGVERGGGRPEPGSEGFSVLYGVSLLDGVKMRRPEEVGRLALASAIADMEHREHVVVTGGAQGWY